MGSSPGMSYTQLAEGAARHLRRPVGVTRVYVYIKCSVCQQETQQRNGNNEAAMHRAAMDLTRPAESTTGRVVEKVRGWMRTNPKRATQIQPPRGEPNGERGTSSSTTRERLARDDRDSGRMQRHVSYNKSFLLVNASVPPELTPSRPPKVRRFTLPGFFGRPQLPPRAIFSLDLQKRRMVAALSALVGRGLNR